MSTDPEPSTESPGGSGRPAGMPRWVKILGVVLLVLALLIVVLHLTGGSIGGPGSLLGSTWVSPLWP